MAVKVNPALIKEIKKYGAFDISACFNCGNCTAICPLSKEDISFPRKMIRLVQIGNEKEVLSSIEPWMCYYCGECSSTCPRQAYPGEFMMSLRRYLISKYDITGVSEMFYKYPFIQNILVVLLFVISFFLFLNYKGDFQKLAAVIEFAFPVYVTAAIGGYVYKMYKHTIIDKFKKFVLSFNLSNIKETIYHGLTQINFIGCSEKDYIRWIAHLLVMTAYILTLIISNLHLLEPLKKHYTFTDIQTYLVLYAGFGIVAGGFIMMIRRFFKKVQSSIFSHSTDWLFVIMLFMIGLTLLSTIVANILLGPDSYIVNILYKLNIAIEIAWIVVIVPFTKWIHIFFRPLAIYLYNLRREKLQTL